MVGVVDIAGLGNVADHIFRDDGARLIAKGVDACTVVHVLGVVVDEVRVNLIILHTYQIAVPAPTQ